MTAVLDAPVPVPLATYLSGSAASLLALLPRRSSRTTIDTDAVTATVGAVLAKWDAAPAALVRMVSTDSVLDLAFARQTLYPTDPVDAVRFLEDVLGETQENVLAAVGVAYRTYHGWQGQGRRPRTTSLAELWPMVQAVALMQGARPGFTGWFRSSPEAQQAFRDGDVNALVRIEAQATTRERRLPDWFVAPDETVDEPAERARRPLTGSRVQTGRAPRRRSSTRDDER